jgi:hypothetical protein
MRDRDVRKALHHTVLKEHHGDTNTLVLDELGLRHGAVRVDVAVVNGHLHGFEIKGDSGTLDRLPSQVAINNAVLDRAMLVVGERASPARRSTNRSNMLSPIAKDWNYWQRLIGSQWSANWKLNRAGISGGSNS